MCSVHSFVNPLLCILFSLSESFFVFCLFCLFVLFCFVCFLLITSVGVYHLLSMRNLVLNWNRFMCVCVCVCVCVYLQVKLVRHSYDFIKVNGRNARHSQLQKSTTAAALEELKRKEDDRMSDYSMGEVPL